MRTLLFTIEYPPFKGGVANYYGNMVKNFPDEILVLHNNDKKLIKWWIWPRWIFAFWHLKRTIKKQKIDHVLVGHLLPLGTVTYYVCRKLNIPYSVFIHGMDISFAMKKRRKRKMALKILRDAKNIICASEYTGEIVSQFLESKVESEKFIKLKEKIHVVHPGIDINFKDSPLEKGVPFSSLNSPLRKGSNPEGGGVLDGEQQNKVKPIVTEKIPRPSGTPLEKGGFNPIILFSVGRLVKRKGVDKVIEAMPEALKNIPNLYYVIAGTGEDEKYLKDLASSLNSPPFGGSTCQGEGGKDREQQNGILNTDNHENYPSVTTVTSPPKGANLNEHIIFLGKVSDEEKWAWMQKCDIFIQPSRKIGDDFEGFGIVYLEAAICGKPVIAGDSGGVGDAVLGGTTGILVNPEKTDRIANAIISLATNKELREKMGNTGKERAEKDFNWKGQAEKIYDLLFGD